MNFTKTALKVGTGFLSVSPSTRYSDVSSYVSSACPANIALCPGMLELAFVSLVTCAIFLKVAAWRDSIRVIYVQELALIPLFTLVAHPVHAYCPLSLTFINSLLLRLLYRVQLVPAPDNNSIGVYTTP